VAAVAAAGVTLVLWASGFIGIRAAAPEISPGALALGRLLVGATALGTLLVLRRERVPRLTTLDRRLAVGLGVAGSTWFGLYFVALNEAERHVDAGTAAMLVNVGPILIAVAAGLLLGERFSRMLFVGLGIAFAGVLVIGFATREAEGVSGVGVLLCLVAAASYAAGVVAQKPVLARLTPLVTVFLLCLVGTLVCLPFAPALLHELGTADPEALAWMAYLGLFPTAIAFTTWAFALARTDAGRLAATTYLVPPLSILLGWLLLDEVPPALAFVGGALCLVGVGVSRRR
jgi:drug/metabolite transporter (DMT)-like permease